MLLKEIIAAIEDVAPPELQEEYDNAGLITGDPEMEINGTLLCLDATEAVLDEAFALNCNLVLSHHPVIFSGLKKLTGAGYVERTLIKAIRHGVALYAAHTNLDNIKEGVNSKICERLALKETRILRPLDGKLTKLITFVPRDHADTLREALFKAGAGATGGYDECSFNTEGVGTFRGGADTHPYVGVRGIRHSENEIRVEVLLPRYLISKVITALRKSHPYEVPAYDLVMLHNSWQEAGSGMIGNLEQPMSPARFLEFLKRQMNTAMIRYTQLNDPAAFISRVAVCGGSGNFLLRDALAAGAHALVTADFKYHQFFDAEGKIMICDIGHYESEQFTLELFAGLLHAKFPTFAPRFTSVNTNPINYY